MGKSEPRGCLSLLFDPFGLNQPRKASDVKIYYVDHSRNQGQPSDELPFKLQRYFLSRTEMSFYHVLLGVLAGHAAICPKVNLKDLFYVPRSDAYYAPAHWNRINQKHVDYLLCDPKTMQPIAGVELDDSSHQRADRVRRDQFVDSVFEAAGLPLIHVSAQRSYNTREIRTLFEPVLPELAVVSEARSRPVEAIAPAIPAPTAPLPAETASKPWPVCPVCGIPMVARPGQNKAGVARMYHVCPNYKSCKQYGLIDVDSVGWMKDSPV